MESERRYSQGLLVLGIVSLTFCMRSTITVVGPQVSAISRGLSVSSSLMGVVTMLPVLAFGFFSPFADKLSARWGIFRCICAAQAAVLGGILVRFLCGAAGLFAGTVLMSLGIAVCNVMIPAMIKKWFSDRVSLMTGVYTASMGTCSALGAGLSIPISVGLGLGWQGALGIWTVPAAAALAVWAGLLVRYGSGADTQNRLDADTQNRSDADMQNRSDTDTQNCSDTEKIGAEESGTRKRNANIWKLRTAWFVTMFMGLQSLLFYSIASWMPVIVQDSGVSSAQSGLLATVFQITGIAANIGTPFVYARVRQQKWMGMGIGVGFFCGCLGLFLSSGMFPLMVILIGLAGLCSGASLSWILTVMGGLGRSAAETAKLSGMAQSVGYLLAALGPFGSGILFDAAGSWTPAVALYLAAGLLLAFFGYLAGSAETLFS